MRRGPSDRALRRLVAEVATADPEDIRGILADLDAGNRQKVQALLADYLGGLADRDQPAAGPHGGFEIPEIDGISPWLAVRLGRSSHSPGSPEDSTGAPAFDMTPAAWRALQACAAALPPDGRPPHRAVGPRGWLAGARGAFLSRRSVS